MGEELLHLSQQDFPSYFVCGKPFIRQGRRRPEGGISQGRDILNTRVVALIRDLWDLQTDTIIDVKLSDADTDTYRFEPMVTILD